MRIFAGADEVTDIYVGSTPVAAVYQGAEQIWPYANAVRFDGTNDYLNRGGDLTGSADSKSGTLAFWIRSQLDAQNFGVILGNITVIGGGAVRFTSQILSNNSVRVFGRNSAAATILNIGSSAGSVEVADGWVSIIVSWSLANAAQRHFYVNDVSDLNVTTYVDDTIDYTTPQWVVGATDAPGSFIDADMADLMFWQGLYVDLSNVSNRRLFISAAGKPVNPRVAIAALGDPIIQLTGPTADWHTNKGTGGGFTENGALTDAATSPSD